MSSSKRNFEKRLRNIVRDHQRLNNGAVHAIRDDGLIVARPRIYNPQFPIKGFLVLFCAAFLFKGYILATLGPITYDERVNRLADGTLVEQAGAWMMQSEPVTLAIASLLGNLGF